MIYSFFTFMVAYCLDIDGMEALSVDIVILIFVGRLDPHMGPVDTTYNTREPSLLLKSSFDFLNFSRFCREVDELLLLVHKSLWHVGDNSWNGGLFAGNCRCQKTATLQELVSLATAHDFFASTFVGRLSGFLQEILLSPVQTCMTLYLLRSSSSVSSSRSISRCWNFLSRICGSIRGNSKSAILFALTKFFPRLAS